MKTTLAATLPEPGLGRIPTRITIAGARKNFGTFPALAGVDLDIAPGELLALLGPSGSGKTTLLRALAGLEALDAGRISFDGQDTVGLSVQARRAGFVFQHYALFGQMTVAENIAFGLTVRPRETRPAKAEIVRRVAELLDVVQLASLGERYPAQLSGGQKQRVALARALAIEPRVLLLDEPFGALDARVRKDLRQWLRRLHEQTGVTTVFVTHDQEEALELADRVVVMNRGRIEQAGSTAAVYEAPATPFVFDFLGAVNVLPGVLGSDGEVRIGPARFAAGSGSTPAPRPLAGPVDVYVRPHDIRLVEDTSPGLGARVTRVQRTGPVVRAALALEGVATADAQPAVLALELSHLDPLAAWLEIDARVRVAPARFSLFSRRDEPTAVASNATPAALPDVPANAVPEQRGGRDRG